MTLQDRPESKRSAESVLAAPRRPVARYRPAVIAAGVGGVLLLVGLGFLIAFGGGRRAARAPAEAPPPAEAAETPTDLDRRLPASYGDPAARPNPTTEPLPVAASSAAAVVEPPAAVGPSTVEQRRAQEALAAHAAPPFFGAPAAAIPAPGRLDPPLPAQPTTAPALTPKQRFVADAAAHEDYVAAVPRAPLSAYEIKAGAVIPAALVTGLNSDLPGPVIAQVTEPVFDHRTGQIVLIPQGTRLIGVYDSQVTYGQDRALVVWTRLVFPSGRSMDLGAMVGADPTGAGGLADRVDTHLPLLARAVGLSSLISVGGAAAQNSLARGGGGAVLQDAAGGVASAASQVGQRLVDRDLQHAPTLRIRPGWPLRVLVDKDLVIAP